MTDEEKIEAILRRWQQAEDQGQQFSIEELCAGAPELAAEVGRRIGSMRTPFVPPTNPPVAWLSPPVEEPQLGHRLGDYELRELLGQGGMGRVFRAFDVRLEREVALKVMLPEVARQEELRRRFLRETKAMAKLQHDHIITIHHVGEVGGNPFFVMPLLRGETLEARRQRQGKLPMVDVIRIGRQTAEGLAHAHQRGLIHRDVKPGNLWLEESTGRVKILDFGLVRMDQESIHLTQPGQLFGTPDFMAPEQWVSGEVDHRCDQYSLGSVLYLLCTGRGPRGRFRDPDVLNPDVPRALSELILRLLSPEPDERFASVSEVARELTSLERPRTDQPREPKQAPPPPRPKEPARPSGMVNSIGSSFALIPAGRFVMGSPPDEAGRNEDEDQREVTITRPFWLGTCPVTQGQWKAVMGSNPSYFQAGGRGSGKVEGVDTDDFPVESVSWQDVQDFLDRLNALPAERKDGRRHRLPSEAEWEYACRAGTSTPFHTGASLASTQANFNGNHPYGGAGRGPYLERTSKVGSYKANNFGLFDLHGNVWEWCSDWYDEYEEGPLTDPQGAIEGSHRVFRGGSWINSAMSCRSALRNRFAPRSGDDHVGFRVVVELR